MKTVTVVSILGVLFLSVMLPLSWAGEDDNATVPGMSGTPTEFTDLQKTLKQDRTDNLERRVSNLEQTCQYLTDRLKDLERTVYDFKSRQ